MTPTVVWCALGAAGAFALVPKLRLRLELSKAKHPSLRGHARMSRWFAKQVPFYEYDESTFFRSDGVAFPSGHVVLVASLAIPIALLTARRRPWIAVVEKSGSRRSTRVIS